MTLKNIKKIRVIIGSLNVGGTEKQLLKIINNLVEKEWKIEVITIKEKGVLAKYLNKKIKVYNLNIKNNLKFIKFFTILFKLIRIFKKDPTTLTHFFLPQSYIFGMISSIISNAKCKLIMSRRSLNLYQKKILFSRTVEKILHKKVDKILVNSNAIRKQLINEEGVSEKKIEVIYNGIKLKKNKKNRTNNNFGIVIIANLIPYKNHAMLLKALNNIKKKLPNNWKLYCIGRDDGIKRNLKNLSKKLKIINNIHWIETLKLEKILINCDLGILCSKEEGFPNAILEYFSYKLPVISSDVGGCREIIKNNKNGILLKKNNYEELSKAIFYIYKNKKDAKKLGFEGYKTAKKRFDLNKMIKSHEEEYIKYVKS
ncbi:MAG: O-antigen biosynthesis glycosyltransferase WbnH [Alphaproteobacteria bacterium MarineAlpha6_Bin4]|nr:MAG: O-antigen biosynthesis glycosyltransferase WbnH [Alphaproteobacteria bacterium MarineAlpha6_Bin3]PPR37083.1 MAG: O-antigen biosynthesis glycosyltransferase WbnH [Alphaproteobacteria bacterium MarineAlpha6_Bin4]|tara:strand:- start:2283 stop:3392 length:1110 start_codon:yes stop_codon:yes gene_type:complete